MVPKAHGRSGQQLTESWPGHSHPCSDHSMTCYRHPPTCTDGAYTTTLSANGVTKQEAWNTLCLHVPHPSPKDDTGGDMTVFFKNSETSWNETGLRRGPDRNRGLFSLWRRDRRRPNNHILPIPFWMNPISGKCLWTELYPDNIKGDIVIWSDKDKCLVFGWTNCALGISLWGDL